MLTTSADPDILQSASTYDKYSYVYIQIWTVNAFMIIFRTFKYYCSTSNTFLLPGLEGTETNFITYYDVFMTAASHTLPLEL